MTIWQFMSESPWLTAFIIYFMFMVPLRMVQAVTRRKWCSVCTHEYERPDDD